MRGCEEEVMPNATRQRDSCDVQDLRQCLALYDGGPGNRCGGATPVLPVPSPVSGKAEGRDLAVPEVRVVGDIAGEGCSRGR